MSETEQVQQMVREMMISMSEDDVLLKAIASLSYKLFRKLMDEGFTREEAIRLVAAYNSKK